MEWREIANRSGTDLNMTEVWLHESPKRQRTIDRSHIQRQSCNKQEEKAKQSP